MSSDLERRYRRVLRVLPGWYRDRWEHDMVAAFLDSWLTGEPAADAYIITAAGPGWAEVASVAGLAVRLHLTGPGTPRRHAWGQAVRRAALAVVLVHAVLGVNVLMFLVWSRRLVGWLPAPRVPAARRAPHAGWRGPRRTGAEYPGRPGAAGQPGRPRWRPPPSQARQPW